MHHTRDAVFSLLAGFLLKSPLSSALLRSCHFAACKELSGFLLSCA
jgi:hypothetical protein